MSTALPTLLEAELVAIYREEGDTWGLSTTLSYNWGCAVL